MYQMFLAVHVSRFMEFLESKREALIRHQQLEITEIKPIITEHYYRDIFVTEFNLHFGLPRSDTCSSCDSFKVRVDAAKTDDEKSQLKKQWEDYLKLAEQSYASLCKDCEMCQESWSQIDDGTAS